MKKIIWHLSILTLTMLVSCDHPPKSFTTSAIKNKGVVIDKSQLRTFSDNMGVFIIETPTDIVSEEINISKEPNRTLFIIIDRNDTIK